MFYVAHNNMKFGHNISVPGHMEGFYEPFSLDKARFNVVLMPGRKMHFKSNIHIKRPRCLKNRDCKGNKLGIMRRFDGI